MMTGIALFFADNLNGDERRGEQIPFIAKQISAFLTY
jgi:hypothetical protein